MMRHSRVCAPPARTLAFILHSRLQLDRFVRSSRDWHIGIILSLTALRLGREEP